MGVILGWERFRNSNLGRCQSLGIYYSISSYELASSAVRLETGILLGKWARVYPEGSFGA